MQITTATITTKDAAAKLDVSENEILIVAKKLGFDAPFTHSQLSQIEGELFTDDQEYEQEMPSDSPLSDVLPSQGSIALPTTNKPVKTAKTLATSDAIAMIMDACEPELIELLSAEFNARKQRIVAAAIAQSM